MIFFRPTRTRRAVFILTLAGIVLFAAPAAAQNTPAELAVTREPETNTTSLLQQIKKAGQDTGRVKTLLKLSHIYWHTRFEQEGALDSSFLWAAEAYNISSRLRFTEGSNEALFLMSKVYTAKRQPEQAKQLLQKAYGGQKVRMLLAIAEYYVFEQEINTAEFAKAVPLINEAIDICNKVSSIPWLHECFKLQAKIYFKQGNVAEGTRVFTQIINYFHQQKDYASEAKYWSSLGNTLPENDSTYKDMIRYHENAVHYYLLVNDREKAAYCFRDLGIVNCNHNRTDTAEKQLLQVVSILKSLNKPVTATTYNIIGDFYRFTAEYDKSLFYTYEALKVPSPGLHNLAYSHMILGIVYDRQKDSGNSLKHYRVALEYAEKREDGMMYVIADDMANTIATNGSPQQALIFLNNFIKKHPNQLLNFRQKFAATYGTIYNLLGNYAAAERYFLEMLSLNKAVFQENGRNLNFQHTTLAGSGSFYLLGKFYTERQRYREASRYLKQSLQEAQYMDAVQEQDIYALLFKADSAMGNYIQAINNYQRYHTIADSANSVAKNRQIARLNIEYQTEQRLKNIESLQQQEEIQRTVLQKTRAERNAIIGGACTLLLLTGLVYRGYKAKKRANRQLELKQYEINTQNETLQSLLSSQALLLKEKEWLVREIHHRVKNNLQIVMGLLSTQSARLQNKDAIEAITKSENRVKSIALIHQKLYRHDNLASIGMPEYVHELTEHLSDVFNAKKRDITFKKEVDNIQIDISQAVPVGLILNEAITNAIKHAFLNKAGYIHIRLLEEEDGIILLSVADNGSGFNTTEKAPATTSIGMDIIRGLARQLRGKLSIESGPGTTIQIRFSLITPHL